jgi:hypothetical protein
VHENLCSQTELPVSLRENASEIAVWTGGVYLTALATALSNYSLSLRETEREPDRSLLSEIQDYKTKHNISSLI